MTKPNYILSAQEAHAIGVKRRYALPALYEHFKDKELRKIIFNYKCALNKIDANPIHDKDLKEELTKEVKDFLDEECFDWKDIVKREIRDQAVKKHKAKSAEPESVDEKPKTIDLVEKYSSQPSSMPFPLAQRKDISDIDSVMSDETKFTDNPKAWSKDTIKKQLVDNLSKMNQLVGDTLTLIDAMKE